MQGFLNFFLALQFVLTGSPTDPCTHHLASSLVEAPTTGTRANFVRALIAGLNQGPQFHAFTSLALKMNFINNPFSLAELIRPLDDQELATLVRAMETAHTKIGFHSPPIPPERVRAICAQFQQNLAQTMVTLASSALNTPAQAPLELNEDLVNRYFFGRENSDHLNRLMTVAGIFQQFLKNPLMQLLLRKYRDGWRKSLAEALGSDPELKNYAGYIELVRKLNSPNRDQMLVGIQDLFSDHFWALIPRDRISQSIARELATSSSLHYGR